jgi:hypothetical protein
MRRGNESVRRRQGYGGLDHLPAEASAKAGGLFDIVRFESAAVHGSRELDVATASS